MKRILKKSLAMLLCGILLVSALPVIGFADASGEMLPNPGMELEGGWVDKFSHLAAAKISFTGEEAHSGEKSLKAAPTNGETTWFMTPSYEFDAGKVYKFSIWIKGSGRIFIGVPCYDASGNPLSGSFVAAEDAKYGPNYVWENETKYSDQSDFEVNPDTWVQKSVYISAGGIVPAETKSFAVSIRTFYARNTSDSPVIYYDDASLVSYDLPSGVNVDGMKNSQATFGNSFWWKLYNGTTYDNQQYHSAPISAKLPYTGAKGEFIRETQPKAWKLEDGKDYECSVWMKTDTATDAPVQILLHTQATAPAILSASPTTEWKQYKAYFTPDNIAEASKWCQFIIYAGEGGTSGTIWMDDIVVRETVIPVSAEISGAEQVNLPDFGNKTQQYTVAVKDRRNADVSNAELVWEIKSDYPDDITISDSGVLSVTDKVLPGKTAEIKVYCREFPDIADTINVSFTYEVSDNFKTQLQGLFKEGTEADTVAFLLNAGNKKPLAKLGVKIEEFTAESFDESDRIAIVAAVKTMVSDVLEENIASFNEMLFLQLVNGADEAGVESILLSYDTEKALGLAENEIYLLLDTDEMATAKQVAFAKISEAGPYTDSGVLKSAIGEKLAAAYMSYITADSMEEALGLVADKTGLSSDSKYITYVGLSDKNSKKIAINTAMVAEYDTYTDIYNKFINAYDNAPSGGTGGSGGGGGGTSGGGSSSGGNKGNETFAVPYEPIVAKPSVEVTPNANTNDNTEKYNDIKSVEWAKEAILTLSDKGIINGYTDGSFKPDNSVTREEFLKMLLSAVGLVKEDAECEFADVDKNEWYYKYVASAKEMDIATGVEETVFGVGENITREQMAAFAMRAMEAVKLAENAGQADEKFSDDDGISDYAKTAVYKMKKLGILNGFPDGSFKPQNGATRAEAAVVIYAIFNLK